MKAAIYARYSSDNQRESSLEDQIRLCSQEAERRGTFSGIDHPGLNEEMRQTVVSMGEKPEDALFIPVSTGSVKGIFMAYGMPTTPEAAAGRLPGTLVSFRFRLTNGRYHVKAFVFD